MLIILASLKLMNELQNPDNNTDFYKNIEEYTQGDDAEASAERKENDDEKD